MTDGMSGVPGFRSLTLADLDDATLERLIDHGEDLLVERKQDLPASPKFGATVGSMANTLGGWILLGVADNGEVRGWAKPERLDLQSHLAAVLRQQVDPLPPFVADMRMVRNREIAVIRVFESADAPHIVRGTGAVYVRSSKGKEPVDDHRTLLDLARRGEDAATKARGRLAETPAVFATLTPPDLPTAEIARGDTADLRTIIRAAPVTVPPSLAMWPLTREASSALETQVLGLELGTGWQEAGSFAFEPHGRATAARNTQPTGPDTSDSVVLIADCAGVIAGALNRGRRGSGSVLLNHLLDDEILPLLNSVVALLHQAEAFGRTVIDVWIEIPRQAWFDPQQRPAPSAGIHASGEITIPASPAEIRSLAEAWHREIQRTLGIVKFEPGA